MNIKEYISSGIIENYVLGLVSEPEREEVLRMEEMYPEIAEAITAYEISLEQYSAAHAVKPPEGLKMEVMAAVRKEKNRDVESASSPDPHNTVRKMKAWRRVAVAAVILLLVSIGFNAFYIPGYQKYKDRYTLLVQNQKQVLAQNQVMEARLQKVEGNLNILMNPDMTPVTMKGVNHHEGLVATVFWNAKSRQPYLGKMNLPIPPSGKAYQLWAIVDGKPVDLGMYNPREDKGPKEMKKVTPGDIQAFAITLEKAGGSPTPTMDQMYVMGSAS